MITVTRLCKRFRLYRRPADRLKEIILRRCYHRDFQALANIEFTVAPGKTLGIIGQNGAGKSTLLKILSGILLPDSGEIDISGKTTGVLELGTGFNFELSGRQNIHLNGTFLGMSRQQLQSRQAEIIAFSELGQFIDEPLKTYSSGMVMRLAFAIAIHADPKCFLVDEVLSVGDAYFQQKCWKKIGKFKAGGGAIIFVSHDMHAVKMLCDQVMLLEHGHNIALGDPQQVVNHYNYLIAKRNDHQEKMVVAEASNSFGTFEARIVAVTIRGEDSCAAVVAAGESTSISVEIVAQHDLDDITVGILIRDRFGQDVFGTNTYHQHYRVNLRKQRHYRCCFRMPLNIGPGKYTITAALHSDSTHSEKCYHWWDNGTELEVAGIQGNSFVGLCRLEPRIELEELSAD